jgi:hypothetical protein
MLFPTKNAIQLSKAIKKKQQVKETPMKKKTIPAGKQKDNKEKPYSK